MSNETAHLEMVWTMTAKHPDGSIIWTDHGKNLVVTEGLNYLISENIPAADLYIGLTDASPTVAAGDTMASHSGWTEVTAYDEATRQAWGQGAASGGVTTNAIAATFTASGPTTVGGGFLSTVATKGTSTGTLFSVKAATEGNRALVDGDTLDVTISLTVISS